MRRRVGRCAAGLAALFLCAACVGQGDPDPLADVCRVERRGIPLPAALAETSGIAASRHSPGVFWSHNDSGDEPRLFALDATGQVLGEVLVDGAVNRDWEDIAVGPCPTGDCIYLADTGDNAVRRDDAALYRVHEPAPGDARTAPAERFPVRYPGGPRDVEALFVLPDGAVFLVSKGRNEPPTLYRYPPPLLVGETITLERVATLGSAALTLVQQVTGADASPGGEWVALRTYGALSIHPAADLLAGDLSTAVVYDLSGLFEPQGEGVAIDDRGGVVLTSEAVRETPAALSLLTCKRQR